MIDFKSFTDAVKTAVEKILDGEDLKIALEAISSKGRGFDFGGDAGLDSLDLLDIMYHIYQETGMKMPNFEGSTLGELYDATIAHNERVKG